MPPGDIENQTHIIVRPDGNIDQTVRVCSGPGYENQSHNAAPLLYWWRVILRISTRMPQGCQRRLEGSQRRAGSHGAATRRCRRCRCRSGAAIDAGKVRPWRGNAGKGRTLATRDYPTM